MTSVLISLVSGIFRSVLHEKVKARKIIPGLSLV